MFNNKFIHDFGAWPLVFEVLDLSMSKGQAKRLLAKLGAIHEALTQGVDTHKNLEGVSPGSNFSRGTKFRV